MNRPAHALTSPHVSASKILCRLGFHKWECKDRRVAGEIRSYCKCGKPGCPRYPDWFFINADPDPYWYHN